MQWGLDPATARFSVLESGQIVDVSERVAIGMIAHGAAIPYSDPQTADGRVISEAGKAKKAAKAQADLDFDAAVKQAEKAKAQAIEKANADYAKTLERLAKPVKEKMEKEKKTEK